MLMFFVSMKGLKEVSQPLIMRDLTMHNGELQHPSETIFTS